MSATLASFVPFTSDESPKIIVLGAGDGAAIDALLARFPHATLTVLESTETGRQEAAARLAPAGERARVAAFDPAALDSGVTFISIEDTGKVWPTQEIKVSLEPAD